MPRWCARLRIGLTPRILPHPAGQPGRHVHTVQILTLLHSPCDRHRQGDGITGRFADQRMVRLGVGRHAQATGRRSGQRGAIVTPRPQRQPRNGPVPRGRPRHRPSGSGSGSNPRDGSRGCDRSVSRSDTTTGNGVRSMAHRTNKRSQPYAGTTAGPRPKRTATAAAQTPVGRAEEHRHSAQPGG